jgi:hypothetical protein
MAAFGVCFAAKLGYPNPRLKEQIRQAAPRYSVQDYLKFDPGREPPPGDVPEDCFRSEATVTAGLLDPGFR